MVPRLILNVSGWMYGNLGEWIQWYLGACMGTCIDVLVPGWTYRYRDEYISTWMDTLVPGYIQYYLD